jgi:polysaccharide export outer membrane protein
MKKALFLFFILGFCFQGVYPQAESIGGKIKPKDTLQISVEGNPDLSKTVRVSDEGTIHYPLLGTVAVAGLSAGEAAGTMAELFKKYYFLNSKVSVSLSPSREKESFTPSPGTVVYEEEGHLPVYKIMPYDTLQISVYGEPDLSATVKVSEEGMIRYALLGEIKVDGLTSDEASRKIEELLKKGYLVNPQVNVVIEEHGKVYIFGEVNQPGSYELKGPLTLVDVIVLAGGLKEEANATRIKVIRVYKEAGQEKPIKEYIIDLDKEGKSFYLYPLDKVFVEKYGRIYVVGAVKNPGVFKLERSDLTPQDAINFLAGGPLDNADLSSVTILRDENGTKKEYVLDLINSEAASFLLKEEDRVAVKVYENISVFGQVRKPGSYPFRKEITVIEAISLAGGFTEVADTNGVKVIRGKEKKKKTIKVPAGYILKSGDKSRDIKLEGGDTIVVPESWL